MIITINIYFVIDHTMSKVTSNFILKSGVIMYSTIYLLMCSYLALHLVVSMVDDSHALRKNPVSINLNYNY